MQQHQRTGFTLIELLIFVAIFGLIIGAFITILVGMVSVQSSQSAQAEVQQQGQFLEQQIQYYVEGARLADIIQDTATGTLTLREIVASSSYDPTVFTLASGMVYLRQGISGASQALTSKKVTISNLSFSRHYNLTSSSSAYGTDSVSYSFTVTANAGSSQYSQMFQSSATVGAPVGKIALIQQAKAENNNPSAAAITAAFPTANDAGDLLVAFVAYRGNATSSVADTAGNGWSLIGTTSFAGTTGTVAIYNALNSVASLNSTTATFSSSATYTSLFIYEYRGASIASSIDTAGAQTQINTTAPVSPTTNPTSSVELLLGIDENTTPSTATFTAGSGYTLETSSTAGNTTQMFVEDMDQNVTSPVTASWTSSPATTSTAAIMTFM